MRIGGKWIACILALGATGCVPGPRLAASWYVVDKLQAEEIHSDVTGRPRVYLGLLNQGEEFRVQRFEFEGMEFGGAGTLAPGRLLVVPLPEVGVKPLCRIPTQFTAIDEKNHRFTVRVEGAMPTALLNEWITDCGAMGDDQKSTAMPLRVQSP